MSCETLGQVMISIHAPHARSDTKTARPVTTSSYFNPRSSCEERLAFNPAEVEYIQISIHAPHARSDFRFGMWPVT